MVKFPTICNTIFYMPISTIRPEGYRFIETEKPTEEEKATTISLCGKAMVNKTILNKI